MMFFIPESISGTGILEKLNNNALLGYQHHNLVLCKSDAKLTIFHVVSFLLSI